MTVALRAGAAGVTVPSPATQQPVTLPSGAQQNDLIQIYCASVSASNSFSCPGFISPGPVSGAGGGTSQLLYKINTTADPPGTIYTVTASFSDTWGAVIVADGNTDQLILFDGGASSGAITNSSALTTNALVTAYQNDRWNWFGFSVLPSGTATLYQPPGFTVQVPQVNSTLAAPSQNIALMFADYVPPKSTAGNPFLCGSLNAAAGNLANPFTVSATTGLGDNMVLGVSVTAGSVVSVADSGGNLWTAIETAASSLTVFQAPCTSVLASGVGVVTVTVSTNTAAVNAFMIDDPGSLLVDISLSNTGTGTSASQATGTLSAPNEHIFAFGWVNTTASSLAWSAPMTAISSALSGNSAGFLWAAYDLVSGTGSVTPTLTWTTSSTYAIAVVTFRPWALQAGVATVSAWSGGVLLGIPPGQPPSFAFRPRLSAVNRYRFAPRLRRALTRGVPQPTGTQFPLFTRARIRPAYSLRATRPRQASAPLPPQGQLTQARPAVFRQSARTAVLGAQWLRPLRRYRIFAPGNVPQGPQAPRWQPPGVSRPGWRRFAPRPRRGQAVMPVPARQAAGAPWINVGRARRRKLENVQSLRYERKRIFAPPPPQGPLPSGNPAIMWPVRKVTRRNWGLRRLQPRWFGHLIPKATQQATAKLTAPSVLTVAGARGVAATGLLKSSSTLSAAAVLARQGTAALKAASTLRAVPAITEVAGAHLTSASTLTAAGVLTRRGTASLQSSSTLTVAATTGSGARLTSVSRLSVNAAVTSFPSAVLAAPSVLSAGAVTALPPTEITIEPLAIPGVTEPPSTTDWVAEPVTDSTVEAVVEPGLYDDSGSNTDS
jgi:hypothetical protein